MCAPRLGFFWGALPALLVPLTQPAALSEFWIIAVCSLLYYHGGFAGLLQRCALKEERRTGFKQVSGLLPSAGGGEREAEAGRTEREMRSDAFVL